MPVATQGIRKRSSKRCRVGTLGVDIGSGSIKMARLENAAGRWNVSNRLVLPVEQPTGDLSNALRDGYLGEQLAVLKKRTLFSQHDCVCVLPPSVTEIRTVEVPHGTQNDVRQMAMEAMRDCFPRDFDQREMQLWTHSESPHGMTMVSGVSVPTDVGEAVVEDMQAVGLNCSAITTLPFALTHALSMSTADAWQQQPTGIISWEHSKAMFIVSRNGRPEFVRGLRDCSGAVAIQRIADGLNLSADEADQVLATVGIPETCDRGSSVSLAGTVEHLLQPEFQNLCDEIQKTLMYLRHHLSNLIPTQLVLFGGMAAVPNISRIIHGRFGMNAQPWSLNAANSQCTDPVFAAAMAASMGDRS